MLCFGWLILFAHFQLSRVSCKIKVGFYQDMSAVLKKRHFLLHFLKLTGKKCISTKEVLAVSSEALTWCVNYSFFGQLFKGDRVHWRRVLARAHSSLSPLAPTWNFPAMFESILNTSFKLFLNIDFRRNICKYLSNNSVHKMTAMAMINV